MMFIYVLAIVQPGCSYKICFLIIKEMYPTSYGEQTPFPQTIFVTILFFKMQFREHFRIFFGLYSGLTIFASQKPQKDHHRSLKQILHQRKLLLLFKISVKVFRKIVIFVILAIIFKVILSFDNFFTSKTPKNGHRSLKWVWHPLNLLASFKVYNKISDKIVS